MTVTPVTAKGIPPCFANYWFLSSRPSHSPAARLVTTIAVAMAITTMASRVSTTAMKGLAAMAASGLGTALAPTLTTTALDAGFMVTRAAYLAHRTMAVMVGTGHVRTVGMVAVAMTTIMMGALTTTVMTRNTGHHRGGTWAG